MGDFEDQRVNVEMSGDQPTANCEQVYKFSLYFRFQELLFGGALIYLEKCKYSLNVQNMSLA